jgi:hypothetical protein
MVKGRHFFTGALPARCAVIAASLRHRAMFHAPLHASFSAAHCRIRFQSPPECNAASAKPVSAGSGASR